MKRVASQHQENFGNSYRAVDLLSQFFVSQGLSYDTVNNNALQNFIKELRPDFEIPSAELVQETAESMPLQYVRAFIDVTEVSVTFDVVNGTSEDDEKYLTFSAHFFLKSKETIRHNLVYFKRLDSHQNDGRTVLNAFLKAVRHDFHPNCNIRNLIAPSREIGQQYGLADISVSNNFICFNNYLRLFVDDVLQIEEFARALSLIRKFVKMIRYNPDLMEKFRKMQMTYNDVVALPTLPKRNWESVTVFLGCFLTSYETLMRFAGRYHLRVRVPDHTVHQLVYLHKILAQCLKYSQELSTAHSSLSQVIPAIVGMKNFIFQLSTGYTFEGVIKRMFANVFQKITSTEICHLYNMATLLDPRFGYHEDVYTEVMWLEIEKKVIRGNSEDNTEERRQLITQVQKYRRWIWEHRPGEYDNPLDWWVSREDKLGELAPIARSLFTCCPVSIDGSYFFGSGGKLSHLCHQKAVGLDNYLCAAGYQQHFKGKGSFYLSEVLEDPVNIPSEVEPDLEIAVEDEYIEVHVKEEQFTEYTPLPPEYQLEESQVQEESMQQEEWDQIVGSSCYDPPAPKLIRRKRETTPYGAKRRHCSLCGQLQFNSRSRTVRNDSERLLLALGSIYSHEIQKEEAILLFNKKRIIICRVHFVTSCRVILDKLGVDHPQPLPQMPALKFLTIMKDITDTFNMQLETAHVQKTVTIFTTKYFNLPEERDDTGPVDRPNSEENEVKPHVIEERSEAKAPSSEPVRKSTRPPKRKAFDDYEFVAE